jgi:very-short-patch-repair endonuclease
MTSKRHRIYPPILAGIRELRQPQTPAETKLWSHLRNRQLGGFKFRRQHPIDRFIVDFYCVACRLVIEIDGDSHTEQVEYNQARTEWLNDRGCHVIRFTNRDVFQRLGAVLEAILQECHKLVLDQTSPSGGGGSGWGGDCAQETT